MALPEDVRVKAAAILSLYCRNKVPTRFKDRIRMSFKFRGNNATLYEGRPKYNHPEEWLDVVVAQFRYDPGSRRWTIYCADRNSRWHKYWDFDPRRELTELLAEVDADPTGIFWG